jgi:hypothetical protein
MGFSPCYISFQQSPLFRPFSAACLAPARFHAGLIGQESRLFPQPVQPVGPYTEKQRALQAAEKLDFGLFCKKGTTLVGPQTQQNKGWALAPAAFLSNNRHYFGLFPQHVKLVLSNSQPGFKCYCRGGN